MKYNEGIMVYSRSLMGDLYRMATKNIKALQSMPRSSFSTDLFKDKEAGEEIIFFNKQDVKTMKKLYSKVNAQIAQNELHKLKEETWANSVDENYEQHRRNLKNLLKTYNIKENNVLLNDLMKWKKVIHE